MKTQIAISSFCILAMVLCIPSHLQAQAASEPYKILPVTIRDFNSSHPDFENQPCKGSDGVKGMVQKTLDKDRKPVHTSAEACPDAKVNEWFRDTKDNTNHCRILTFKEVPGKTNFYSYENKEFFPLDDVEGAEKMRGHNYHFCMELHANFKYRGGEIFDFTGDDDVWVFINNKLALDLGGEHRSLSGSVNLDNQKSDLGIDVGKFYNFDFFICERQTVNSVIKISTSIDILPPTYGLSIADGRRTVIDHSKPVVVGQGQDTTFLAIKTIKQEEQKGCKYVDVEQGNPTTGNWTFAGKALGSGTEMRIKTGDYAIGTHWLVVTEGALRDSIQVTITPMPLAAKPTANPPGKAFSGSLQVSLSTATSGASIHYTIDGSTPTASSPLYSGPVTLSANTTLKAIAVKQGFLNSEVMTETYSKNLARATGGKYQDTDGDGRIETAVILFDENYSAPPVGLLLTDPFNAKNRIPPTNITPGTRSITVTFPPFTPGTSFPPAQYGTVLAMPNEYVEHPFSIEDGVGPQILKAESFPAIDGVTQPELIVQFSEEVSLDVSSKSFPLEIKRNGSMVNQPEVKVASIENLGGNRYKFRFEVDSKYPIPNDSLRIAPTAGLKDAKGNAANMTVYIGVDGKPAAVVAEVGVKILEPVNKGTTLNPQAITNPVVFQSPQGICPDCQRSDVQKIFGTGEAKLISQGNPSWVINTKYRFRYKMSIFDNLGQFVNKAQGEVPAAEFDQLKGSTGIKDSVKVIMTFIPVSYQGRQLGTGAYILAGEIQTVDGADVLTGPQGEQLVVQGAKQLVFSRFGYLRKD